MFLIDPVAGIREQDKHVVGYATDESKAIIIVVNKWDAVVKTEKTMDEYRKKFVMNLSFWTMLQLSSLVLLIKPESMRFFNSIDFVEQAYNLRIPTNTLNGIIQDAQIMNETPLFNGGRLKIYYANQVAVKPPTFVLFVNDPSYMHFSYKRYLENRLR